MSDPMRSEVEAFARSRFPDATILPLAGDASTRRFFRLLCADGSTRVLMDYGRPFEGETDDQKLSRLFLAARLPVAPIEAASPAAGCLLLRDLGDRTLESALSDPALPPDPAAVEHLYERAIELAVAIAVRGTGALERSDRASGPALDEARFRFEMDFFLEHYVAGFRGLGSVPGEVRAALHRLGDAAAASPRRVLCHRDFHSRNLMVLADGSLAMVDIQDARWGPDTYDLASLLQDAYVDIDPGLADRMAERYRASLPDPPEASAFRARYAVVAAQRMIKALGTFGYQASVLGRSRYLEGVPRTIARLRHLLPLHAETRDVASVLRSSGVLGGSYGS